MTRSSFLVPNAIVPYDVKIPGQKACQLLERTSPLRSHEDSEVIPTVLTRPNFTLTLWINEGMS